MLLKRIEYNFAISIVYKVTQPQKILSSDMYGLAYWRYTDKKTLGGVLQNTCSGNFRKILKKTSVVFPFLPNLQTFKNGPHYWCFLRNF